MNKIFKNTICTALTLSLLLGAQITVNATSAKVISGSTDAIVTVKSETMNEMVSDIYDANFTEYAYKMSAIDTTLSQTINSTAYKKVDGQKYFNIVPDTELASAIKTSELKPNFDVINNVYYRTETVSPATVLINLTKISDNDYRIIENEIDTSTDTFIFNPDNMVVLNDKTFEYTARFDGTIQNFITVMNAIDTSKQYIEGKDNQIHEIVNIKDAVKIIEYNEEYFIAKADTLLTNSKYVNNCATEGLLYKWELSSNQTLPEVIAKFNNEVSNVQLLEKQLTSYHTTAANPIIANFINKVLDENIVSDDAVFGKIEYLDLSGVITTESKINFTTDTIGKMSGDIIVLHFNKKTEKWERIQDAVLMTSVDNTKYISGTFKTLSPVIVFEVKTNNLTQSDTKTDATVAPKTGEEFDIIFFN